MKKIMTIPLKIKSGINIVVSNLTPNFITERNEITIPKGHLHLCVHCINAALFTISRMTWKQPKCLLMDGWYRKLGLILPYDIYIYIIFIYIIYIYNIYMHII